MSKHYAAGVYRRLAEQHSNERHHDLTDYNHQPTIDEIVTDMVEHGYDEETARSSAQTLFDDEIYSTPS